jgi:site-specific DNA-cytosine methylase
MTQQNHIYVAITHLQVAIKRADIFIAGFSCKSISALSTRKHGFRACTSTMEGQTGSTWSGILNYAATHRPPCIILENVTGLDVIDDSLTQSNLDTIISELRRIGYTCSHWILQPTQFMLPQRRLRIWIIALLGGNDTEMSIINDTMHTMSTASSGFVFPLDCFLHATDDSVLHTWLNRAHPATGADRAVKWPEQHKAAYQAKFKHNTTDSTYTTHWKPEISPLYPGYSTLTPRERDILDYNEIRFPDSRDMVIDVSQSINRTPRGDYMAVPCITPHARQWLSRHVRLLTPIERMRLQGMFIDANVASQFTDALLADLAGNGMCGPIALAAM